MYRGYQQQDAHEFMRYLLDELHEELCRASCWTMDRKGTTIVSHTFGGTLQSDVVCLICGAESQKLDPMLGKHYLCTGVICYSVCRFFFGYTRAVHLSEKRRQAAQLYFGRLILYQKYICLYALLIDCLKSFTSLEKLDESEWYYCEKCGSRQQSSKKLCMYSLPNVSVDKLLNNMVIALQVLCLHLKRFRFTSFLRSKVDVYVEFPLKGLDISPYVNQVPCHVVHID